MTYEFFFSYTRDNNDPYVRAFFEDLQEEVRQRCGLPAGAQAGFFDQRSIALGEDWEHDIVAALQSSKVMVSLASPAYFMKDFCGIEWALFRRRCEAAAGGGVVPPLLKSVVWIEFPIDRLPPEVKASQLTLGDPHSLYNTKGARHLLKLSGKRDEYVELLDSLTTQIVSAGEAYPLPPLADVPALADVPSAFHVAAAPGPVPPPVAAGPRQVNFIYVATHPDRIPAGRQREAYVELGGGDWRPFFPADARRAHQLMQNIASDPALDFDSVAVPFGADLIANIEAAWRQRQIVVIVVDAWSLHWDAQQPQPVYRDLLQKLDGRIDYHWCVLVPWNQADGDAASQVDQAEQVRQVARRTFDRHARLMPSPMFYRDGIRSVDEFRKTVTEVLTLLKEEIRNNAPVLRTMPPGPRWGGVSGPTG